MGPAAPGVLLDFLCSSLIAGRLLFREVDDHGLALLAGIGVYVLLIGLMVHFPINYPLVYAGLIRRSSAGDQTLAPSPASSGCRGRRAPLGARRLGVLQFSFCWRTGWSPSSRRLAPTR